MPPASPGTDPEAGLDIEPDPRPNNFMHNVLFRNVSFVNNFGGGILISLGRNLGNATMPIGVRFEDCRVNGTGGDAPLYPPSVGRRPRERQLLFDRAGLRGANPNAVCISGVGAPFVNSGEISFHNLSVSNSSGGDGLTILNIPESGYATVLVDRPPRDSDPRNCSWGPRNSF